MEKIKTYSNINKSMRGRRDDKYKLIAIIGTIICVIYQIMDTLNFSMQTTIYVLMVMLVPMCGIYFTVSKEENISQVLADIFRYLFKTKIYVYRSADMEKGKINRKYSSIKYSCKNK